jgi:hypothetical protein
MSTILRLFVCVVMVARAQLSPDAGGSDHTGARPPHNVLDSSPVLRVSL